MAFCVIAGTEFSDIFNTLGQALPRDTWITTLNRESHPKWDGSWRGLVIFHCLVLRMLLFSCSVMSDSLWAHDCTMPGFPVLNYFWGLLKVMCIESVMPPSHLVSCCLLLLPSVFPSVRESQLFQSGGQSIGASSSKSVLPMNIQGWFPFGSVQSLSCVWFFAIPWTAAHQASLSIINSQLLLKLMSIESVMPSKNLVLCHPLLLLPLIYLSIRVISNEFVLHIR